MHDKSAILERVRQRVRDDLEVLKRAHEDAREGITHEDARQESSKDMRSTEASYIARGQARRVAELQDAVAALDAFSPRAFAADDPVALGALVEVETEAARFECFIVPAAGGMDVISGSRKVRTVTPRSPLGQAVLGRAIGDGVTWQTPQGEVEGIIQSVA